MEVVNCCVKPLVQIIFRQNIRLRHALEEMTQHNQYTGNDFYIIDPFSLVLTAVFSPITSSPADLQLIHAVRMLGEQSLELVNQNPGSRLPDILVHSRADRTDHPAVTVAAANLCTNLSASGLFHSSSQV